MAARLRQREPAVCAAAGQVDLVVGHLAPVVAQLADALAILRLEERLGLLLGPDVAELAHQRDPARRAPHRRGRHHACTGRMHGRGLRCPVCRHDGFDRPRGRLGRPRCGEGHGHASIGEHIEVAGRAPRLHGIQHDARAVVLHQVCVEARRQPRAPRRGSRGVAPLQLQRALLDGLRTDGAGARQPQQRAGESRQRTNPLRSRLPVHVPLHRIADAHRASGAL